MYQSFTGTSRKPRQVNLSGRSGNPFSARGLGGPQAAIDSAKEDRARRAQERERLQASRRIQRVWRGHSARRKTFSVWRSVWDNVESHISPNGTYDTAEASLSQLKRLLLFFSPSSDRQDVRRLNWYGMRQASTADKIVCDGDVWSAAYLKLQKACLDALRLRRGETLEELDTETVRVLAFAARRANIEKSQDAMDYYSTLMDLRNPPADALQHALLAPLHSVAAHAGLAVLLAHPMEADTLALLQGHVNTQQLAEQIVPVAESAKSARKRLWLLANIICLCGIGSLSVTTIVAKLLGSLAGEVEFEDNVMHMDNMSFDRDVLAKIETGFPLNTFLSDQFSGLVKQESIRNLLVRGETSAARAQMFANLALTLLRCYPRKADEIRMWLYLGPTNTNDLPATQYFWQAMKTTSIYSDILADSRNTVALLQSSATSALRENWTVILIFLELYTFQLKIMDDEEFMGAGRGARNSAIPIQDVAHLVTFLKNLGFTIYFNAAELDEDAPKSRDTGMISSLFSARDLSSRRASQSGPFTIAGMAGVTVDYLKGIVTGLLRAIYERDSRRHFLPKDHWLMTSRFDMTAFIPGVVQEEENRHLVADKDDEDNADLSDEDDFGPVSGRGPASAHRMQEARLRAQRKASRRRYLESVAPRLEILQNMPFFIPFYTRVEIFRQFVTLDQSKRRGGSTDPDIWRSNLMFNPPTIGRDILARHHAQVKRKQEFEDAYSQFYELGSALKEPIQITFLDEFGLQEAGIDGGGVTKEFLTSVINQALDPASTGMDKYFIENEAHLLYPNPTALEDAKVFLKETFTTEAQIRPFISEMLRKYEFLGRIIGKCLYEGILVDVAFAGFFLKKWALTGGHGSASGESGYRASINDLREFDEALYHGLLAVKNTKDASEFGLTFSVDDMVGPEDNRQVVETELIAGGAQIAVTNDNRLIYIDRMSKYRLQRQSALQTNAFLKGLSSIIQPSWLSMFNQSELQTLVGGTQSGIDVQDLRRSTQYGGVYVIGDDGQEHPSVKLFWKIMESLADADKRKVLKFVTSTPRGPLLGFSNLNPRFSIRDSGSDENRFPTTSTCVNLLKLPMYKTEGVMRKKLLEAVNSGAGFDLS